VLLDGDLVTGDDSMTRVVGWGLFPLPGERRRRAEARERALADLRRARGSVDEQGEPVPADWGNRSTNSDSTGD